MRYYIKLCNYLEFSFILTKFYDFCIKSNLFFSVIPERSRNYSHQDLVPELSEEVSVE